MFADYKESSKERNIEREQGKERANQLLAMFEEKSGNEREKKWERVRERERERESESERKRER